MATLEMRDGTKFILRQNSQVRVTGSGSVKIEKGSGFFIVPSGRKIEVDAYDTKIRVKGTEFSVTLDDNEGIVKLVEGELEIQPVNQTEPVIIPRVRKIKPITQL